MTRNIMFVSIFFLFGSSHSYAGFLDSIFEKVHQADQFTDQMGVCQSIRKEQYDRLRRLVKNNANLNSSENMPNGCDYPIIEASKALSIEAVKIIAPRIGLGGMNRLGLSGKTALHSVVWASFKYKKSRQARSDAVAIAKFLLASGASLKVKDNTGDTPIELAKTMGQTELLESFMKFSKRTD